MTAVAVAGEAGEDVEFVTTTCGLVVVVTAAEVTTRGLTLLRQQQRNTDINITTPKNTESEIPTAAPTLTVDDDDEE